MLVGYARTSTLEQEAGLEAQQRELKALGCSKLFSEQTSSIGPRPALEQAMDFCREGDTLVVTKLDPRSSEASPAAPHRAAFSFCLAG
jgi:DNA invertase Pin-like site-specific DNA recombinase